jgi:hypothetical protein
MQGGLSVFSGIEDHGSFEVEGREIEQSFKDIEDLSRPEKTLNPRKCRFGLSVFSGTWKRFCCSRIGANCCTRISYVMTADFS